MSEVTVATILRASTRALMGKNRDYLRVFSSSALLAPACVRNPAVAPLSSRYHEPCLEIMTRPTSHLKGATA